ncbi:hypothetical protein ABKV19_027099 [Rosa sericea]
MVTNWKNELLWYQSAPILQKLSRDVLDEVAFRWANKMGVPPLNTYSVKVRDNKAYIPRQGSRDDSRNYAHRYLYFILSVYGPVADNRLLDDFCRKLSQQNLTLLRFQNLYFHKLLQSREEINDFPVVAVENLRLRKYFYNGRVRNWDVAYRLWAEEKYHREINLFETCIKNIYVWRAYNYRIYADNPTDEAELVRNLIIHFNQCRMKNVLPPADFYDKNQIGEVVFDLFPDIDSSLFDFMYERGVYMDFTALRTFYRE